MNARRRLQALMIGFVVALVSLVTAAAAFTTTSTAAGTRVRDFSIPTGTSVAVDEHVQPGGVGDLRRPQPDLVSATGVATNTADAIPGPSKGQTVYRVYGGDSAPGGASWSPSNPGSVSNYRDLAGLPSGGASGANNTGRFVIEGVLEDPAKVVVTRTALPLDGTRGGLPEYIVPGWLDNGAISITRVSGVNPAF